MPKSAVEPMNSSKNKLNSEIILIFHLHPNAHLGSVWILFIAENWKHYNKIVFKCINSIVRPIFNVYFAEKRDLWVLWTVHGTHLNKKRAAGKRKMRFPNARLMFMSYTDIFLLGSGTMPFNVIALKKHKAPCILPLP